MDTSMSTQVIGEIIGTMVLVLLGDGVVAGVSLRKTKAEGAGWIAITLGWGAAVTIGAYAAGYMSFAHLNPAVTIGMAIAGKIGWDMVVPYILGQMIGAIIGAVLVYIHYYPHWKETKDQATILGVFATGPAIRSLGANLISEIIGTFMLVFALLAFGMSKFGDGLNSNSGWDIDFSNRSFTWRYDRLCDQSSARSWSANRPCVSADSK